MTKLKAASTRREFFCFALGAGLWLTGADSARTWADTGDAPAGGSPGSPTVNVTNDAVMISSGEYSASLSLVNAQIDIHVDGHTYHLSPTILYDSAWTTPTAAQEAPAMGHDATGAEVRVTYPVVDNREFTVSLTCYHDIPGIYVISHLTNLGKLRQEYYYWYWDGDYTSYFAPQEGKIVERHPDLSTLDRFGYNDWVYLPEQSGGLALLTKQVLGRGSEGDKTTYLNALPINQYIGQGQSMDMGIGFVQAYSPEDAQQIQKDLATKAIPALNVTTQIPDLKALDYGEPAPKWLQAVDKYNDWPAGKPGVPEAWMGSGLAHSMHPFRFISHVANDKDVIDRCHSAGVRVIMYINFMEMLDSTIQQQAGPKGAAYLNGNWGKIVDHENMDIGKHLNWISYDEKGKERQSGWGAANNIPGLFNTCLHQKDLQDAVAQQVTDMLALGVDGIFIDNASGIPDCYGDKFGKHAHDLLGRTNTEMYNLLLQRVYSVVKGIDKEKIVVINSGINPNQWSYCDAQMSEACLYGAGVVAKTCTWEDAKYMGEMQAEAVRHGKIPIILSYFDAQPIVTRTDRALYTYAYARLYDLGWSDFFTMVGADGDVKDAQDLYNAHLGKPVGVISATDRVHYRLFENGVVLVNPDLWGKTVTIPVTRTGKLYDVCHYATRATSGKSVTVEMTPESGRVLLWKQS